MHARDKDPSIDIRAPPQSLHDGHEHESSERECEYHPHRASSRAETARVRHGLDAVDGHPGDYSSTAQPIVIPTSYGIVCHLRGSLAVKDR